MRNDFSKIAIMLVLLCITVFAQQKGTFKDNRDGKAYKAVKIGDQIWMAENLNYDAKGSKCYDNKLSNCEKYGKLYDWKTAMEVCPQGWHLPSNLEWNSLYNYIGDKAESKLKAKSGWNDYDPCASGECEGKRTMLSGNGEDKYGFSALPSGYFSPAILQGDFDAIGTSSYWWVVSNDDISPIYYQTMRNSDVDWDDEDVYKYRLNGNLFSVRCLKDDANYVAKVAAVTEYLEAAAKKVKANSSTFTDSRDGKTYKTIKIGAQTWMAENLNYKANGSKCYDNNESNCKKYGRLYNWEIAMKSCPKAWHLPSNEEWQTLVDLVGGNKKLKARNGWESGNGTDIYGFSALPGGNGNSDGNFYTIGNGGYWWSASESKTSSTGAWLWGVIYDDASTESTDRLKSDYYSVRCIRN